MKTSPPKATLYLGALLPFVIAPADAAAGGFGEVVDLSECK